MAARGWRWGCALVLARCWFLILGQDKIEVPENSAVNLPCKITGSASGPRRIEWKFQKGPNAVLFYYDNQFTADYKDRAVFFPNEIHFNSVTRKDSGIYTCEVLVRNASFQQFQVQLIVQVPPSKPKAHVPSMVTIGNKAVLRCEETDANPRPKFKWFKNNIQMPTDPKTSSLFRNSSYTIDPETGVLVQHSVPKGSHKQDPAWPALPTASQQAFEPATALDAGDYSCEAENKVGAPQKSAVVHMETSELNVGGIVAAVVVLLLIIALAIFGVWFAYSRGYFSKTKNTTNKKVIYSHPSTRSDGEFKQTSSFLV